MSSRFASAVRGCRGCTSAWPPTNGFPIRLSERISPLIVNGDLYRLARPDESKWPAFLYLNQDKSEAVLLASQVYNTINIAVPTMRLEGLEPKATYSFEAGGEYRGDTLMSAGLRLPWKGDYQSRVMFLMRK